MTARRVARVLIDSPLPQLDRLFDYADPRRSSPPTRSPACACGCRCAAPGASSTATSSSWARRMPSDRPLSELDAVVSPVPRADARRSTRSPAAPPTAPPARRADILRLAIPKRMVRAEKAWLAAEPPAAPAVDDAARAWADARARRAIPGSRDALDRRGRGSPSTRRRDPSALADGADGRRVGGAARRRGGAHARRGPQRDPRRPRSPRPGAARGGAGRPASPADAIVRDDARQSSPARYAAFLRTLAPAPCIVDRQPLRGVRAGARRSGSIAIWDDGDPLLAEPLSPGVHARDAALHAAGARRRARCVFAGHTRTTDVERLVAVGWVREVSAARRASPRVVLSATREGESRGARVPSAAFAAAREALAQRTGARAGRAARVRPRARVRRLPAPRPLPALRRAAARARGQGAVPECGWCGRAAPRLDVPELRVDARADGLVRQRAHRRRARPRVSRHPRSSSPTASTRSSRSTRARRSSSRPAAPSRSPTGGYRAVILLDGDRMLLADDLRIGESCLRWWSNAAALAAPGAPVHLVGVAGPGRPRARDLDPAGLRPRRARRPRAAADAAHRPRRRARGRRSAPSTPPSPRCARRCPRSTTRPCSARCRPATARARALVRFDYALGAAVAESLRGSVVAEALSAGRTPKGRAPAPRNTLRVRVDVPDLDL